MTALPSLEATAASLAARDEREAAATIEAKLADAVRRWQLDEALFWQRVQFRMRMLRARRARTEAAQ
jgi:hypothetical protein